MSYPLPRWIAHCGGGALAPENTLAGIRLAARLGFRAVEFDVMLTADGVPILIHDETLERTTNARGQVADTPWQTIAEMDAGAHFHKAWSGEPLPRLDQALAACAALGLGANVEIKPAAGHEAATGSVVAEAVARQWPAGLPLLLSSFATDSLAAARATAPELPRALLLGPVPVDWAERLEQSGCIALHPHADVLLPERAAELQAAGVPWAAYTVNSESLAERCFHMGAAALFTDRLDRFGPV